MCNQNNNTTITLEDLSKIIGLSNTASQTVLTGGTINVGPTYRQFSKSKCGKTYTAANGGVTIQKSGFYHVTATLVGAGTAAGDVTVQLFQNGIAIPAAISTQTITTADTEFRTFVIDYFVPVNNTTILGCETTVASSLTLVNTGVGATFTNVVLNVEKVV